MSLVASLSGARNSSTDKIAAALVAQNVFKALAKKKSDPDDKWQLEEGQKRFQALAMETLRNCHHMNEVATEGLLTKPCPWWGGVSVLQLAIMTCNRQFMTQTACKDIMTRIWRRLPPVN
ncbi:transient receptor potential cation channel subfamily M member 8-like [Littorina saxatilis]|uniref:transient receptor potential cation channel subfamily M member 8-like n=1 Tax=Littorina saxatilis TaxID=31220 RepID=UPI0038B68C4B